MCRCSAGQATQPPKRSLWPRITEWMCGKPEDNERRAIKYLRAQLCRLNAHQRMGGPAPNVEKCEWCGTLMHARENNPFASMADEIRKHLAKDISMQPADLHNLIDEPTPDHRLYIRKTPTRNTPPGPAQTIRAMRGWKMSSDEADRILRELVKRAPQDWAAGGPPITKKKKPRRGR